MKLFITLALAILSTNVLAITIGAYNIRNFDYDQRYRISTDKNVLSNMLKEINADVLSVEEINNTKEFESFIPNALPGYESELTICGGAHGQRLGFIYNTKTVDLLSFNEDLTISNPGGPGTCDAGSRPMAVALFQIKATKQKFYAMTVHLKSGSQQASIKTRHAQFGIIQDMIVELKSKTGVQDFYVAGDFNTTEYENNGTDFRAFTKMLKDLNMIDLAAKEKCSAYWWGGSDDGIETPSLLDHVIVTPGLVKIKNAQTQVTGHCKKVNCQAATLKDLGISYESVSDHCPIFAKVQ